VDGYFFAAVPSVFEKEHTMNQMNVLSRQDNASAGVTSASQVVLRRILTVENMGDAWRRKVFSGIRLKGQWLTSAGFHPGHRVAVTVVSRGVMELRLVGQSEADSQSATRLPIGEAGIETQQEKLLPLVPLPDALPERPLDMEVSNHGTVSLFHPLSERASGWLEAHCPVGTDHQYCGRALAVEARFVPDLLHHVAEDGLSVAR
jgi:hypothetical protein